MRKVDNLDSCSETLMCCVRGVLSTNKYIQWELLSCSDDGDLCRSEFVAPIEGSDLMRYFAVKVGPSGVHGYTTISSADALPGIRKTV